MIFFFVFFSNLKLGFFHSENWRKKRFGIANITVKRPKRRLSKYMKQTIIMPRLYENWKITNILFK